jgi:hypothetical protein
MFTLLKFAAGVAALLAFAWFGMTFKLGERTLFEHLHAIGQTKESQELVDGTRQAVRHHVGESKKDERPPSVGRDAGAPLERLSSSEQRQLRYLLDKASH